MLIFNKAPFSFLFEAIYLTCRLLSVSTRSELGWPRNSPTQKKKKRRSDKTQRHLIKKEQIKPCLLFNFFHLFRRGDPKNLCMSDTFQLAFFIYLFFFSAGFLPCPYLLFVLTSYSVTACFTSFNIMSVFVHNENLKSLSRFSLPLNQSLSFRVWFPPLWTALTMQMCRRRSVRNLGAGINISRRQKIWWVSKTEGRKVWRSHFCLFTHTHTHTFARIHTSRRYNMFSNQPSLCLAAFAWSRNAFLSCYLIIQDCSALLCIRARRYLWFIHYCFN